MAYRRKLYFNVRITCGTGGVDRIADKKMVCPCTWLCATVPGIGNRVRERYGNLLQPMAALTGGAVNNVKIRNAVSAWFQPKANFTNSSRAVSLDFVGQDFSTPIPYRLPGGGISASLPGADAIYTRHFAVRVRTLTVAMRTFRVNLAVTAHTGASAAVVEQRPGATDIAGVVYVQRQHSIEV